MGYKEHKKMYKIGKKWAVATLVSASVLMGGALIAHADQVEANTANETQTVNATQQVTDQTAVTSSASSAENTKNDKVASVQANTVANSDEQTQLKQNTTDESTTSAQTNLSKLNPAAANAVKNAKIDAGNLTDDQINELNKIDFSKSAEKGAKLNFNDLEGCSKSRKNRI